MSFAEAARLRGVSRQSIAKLVERGRLAAVQVGPHLVIRKTDVLEFERKPAGRPKKVNEAGMRDGLIEEIDSLAPAEKQLLFSQLRKSQMLHSLESEWNTSAEAILEAIRRAPDITQRGVRGILAEAIFCTQVLPAGMPAGWKDTMPPGDHAFDSRISNGDRHIRIQVKLQRQKEKTPMLGKNAVKSLGFSDACYVVETQKTRAGKKDGEDTRPYRFDEFDILAVSLAPSTKDWTKFRYSLTRWLLPEPKAPALINKFQPVPKDENQDWTNSIETAISWFLSDENKTISRVQ